jgi:putative component of membrane protein insertase Oxa1/YidC/SpoIIIJ protein YidD
MKLAIYSGIIFLFLLPNWAAAQNEEDLILAAAILREAPQEDYSYSYSGETEILEFFKILFSGYKALVSSQDVQACNFHPSCSVYAMQAVRQKGVISGSLHAFDRMSRCHPLSLHQYEQHAETGLAFDPLEAETE